MFAVVETGGKQYKATPGGFIEVEKLPGEKGQQIVLERVLLVADGDQVTVGQPLVSGATVVATVALQARRRKVLHFHYVPKKRQRVKTGHRQPFTRLRIEAIEGLA
ncbi:MAG: 50S ribosomal protein L21 [Nitrososphaerales archaeon]